MPPQNLDLIMQNDSNNWTQKFSGFLQIQNMRGKNNVALTVELSILRHLNSFYVIQFEYGDLIVADWETE